MVNNTWAYSTDDINYQGVPTLDSPVLLSDIDGISTGTNTNGVVSATIPIYYAAKVDTSIPSGSYANSVTYSAVVDGGIVTSAELTSITVDGNTVEQLQLDKTNTILITTNLKTNTYGTPRVYYTTTNPSGYAECGNVVVASNAEGYMTIQCETTPTTVATGLTLHIVPKGTPSNTNPSDMTGDPFCSDGTYEANTSQCEAGEWKWGSFTVSLPNIKGPVFNGIKTMQEMTPEICADAQENDTTMLEDARDGKMYWVAKLADGNCWMTQNLDLDLSGRTLTPSDSDVSSSWTYNGSWYNSAADGSNSSSAIQAWDLGEYVKTSLTAPTNCGDITTDLSACPSQFTEVTSNMTPYTEAVNEGKLPADNVAVSGSNYDAHYLVGNYYSWPAATAGSGNKIEDSGDAADSICPANWRLPLGGDTYDETPGSFYYLLNQYGLASSPTSGNNNIATSPLYFVCSGYVTPYYSYLDNAGYDGYYWPGRAESSRYASYLRFRPSRSSGVWPSSSGGRYFGNSVRCVAAG